MPEHPSSNPWPTAAADLYEKYHEQVLANLKAAYPHADMDARHDAFVQALLETADKVDPARGDVAAFLTGAAKRILRTTLRSDSRRRKRERAYGQNLVADKKSAARNSLDMLADAEMLRRVRDKIARTEEERIMLDHWGKDFREVAQALNITHLTMTEQQARVKDIRDRLGQRLKRWKGKS
jgi:DNA-directed RNA polymerase specialized sigma24 family protein